jgi:hypothetical protein
VEMKVFKNGDQLDCNAIQPRVAERIKKHRKLKFEDIKNNQRIKLIKFQEIDFISRREFAE